MRRHNQRCTYSAVNMRNIKNYPFFGADPYNQVFDRGDHVIRQVKSTYFRQAQKLFGLYQKFKLSRLGIVETEIDERMQKFVHKKHIISYPHEWPVDMF